MGSNRIWVSDHQPKSFEAIKYLQSNVKPLLKFVEKGSIPNLIFFGPPGTSKTTVALACCRALYGEKNMKWMYLHLNASDARGIDVVRSQISNFAQSRPLVSTKGICPLRTIILDECDQMTPAAQMSLRRIIEDNAGTTRFIFICNYINKISAPIQSRCFEFRFQAMSTQDTASVLLDVLEREEIDIDHEIVQHVARASKGDLRCAINTLQQVVMSGADINNIVEITGSLAVPFADLIKTPSDLDGLIEKYGCRTIIQWFFRHTNDWQLIRSLACAEVAVEKSHIEYARTLLKAICICMVNH